MHSYTSPPLTLSLPEATQHLQVPYLSPDVTYLHVFSACGEDHLLTKLEVPGQIIYAPSCMNNQPHNIRGREGHWGPWIHGILSPQAELKPSLFSLQPLPTNQSSALSDLCTAVAEL